MPAVRNRLLCTPEHASSRRKSVRLMYHRFTRCKRNGQEALNRDNHLKRYIFSYRLLFLPILFVLFSADYGIPVAQEKKEDTRTTSRGAFGLAACHTRLRQCFAGDATHVHLVMNADRLSLSEAVRIQRRLSDIRIAINRVVVNKLRTDDGIATIAE